MKYVSPTKCAGYALKACQSPTYLLIWASIFGKKEKVSDGHTTVTLTTYRGTTYII